MCFELLFKPFNHNLVLLMVDEKTAYIQGRLLGLSELVSILKEASENSKDVASSPLLIKTLISHIASEMDEIISEMKIEHGEGHPVIKKAEKAQSLMEKDAGKSEKKPSSEVGQSFKKHVENADELMKNLVDLQKQAGE